MKNKTTALYRNGDKSMIDKEIQKIIELTVEKTIAGFKKSGLLKDTENVAYSDASAILSSYYKTDKKDASITYAIQGIRFDPYARIIPMYYEQGKTLETIAEELGVDVSTVVRNKKRLCLAIYNEII